MDTETKKEIQAMIDAEMKFSNRKVGDTPTDANQLVPKNYVDSKIYAGFVNLDGSSGLPFPTGWTSANLSSGAYRITHNLGTTNYSVVATLNYLNDGNLRVALLALKTSTTFDIELFGFGSGSNSNGAFSFALSTR